MERINEVRNHPMLEDIRNNLKMRGIFISETTPYSYENEIEKLEERKIKPQEFLDYIVEKDMFNEELKSIELADKAIESATKLGTLDDDTMEALQKVLDDNIKTHNTTIRHKARSEATISIANKDIIALKQEKINALHISDEDILDFLTEFI